MFPFITAQHTHKPVVAYLVCERNGVKTKSEIYLSNFVKAGKNVEQLDLYQIMRAAGQVETTLKLTRHTKFPKA